jgi:DnaJ-class molecular chaperone
MDANAVPLYMAHWAAQAINGTRQVECYSCKGKGTYPVAGFLAVIDWPCGACKGTGKIPHPQDRPQPGPSHNTGRQDAG